MPIHFSIGFVLENWPKRRVDSVCAKANTEEKVEAIAAVIEYIDVCWPTDVRDCK